MYALIINGEVTATGNPPTAARDLTTGQWVTPPGGVWTPEAAAACGWHEVTETPRPEPVEGGVHESAVELVDGLPVRVWTWRAWTAEEIAAQEAAAAYEAQRLLVKAIITDLRAEKARAQTVIDTANATINASPASYIKDTARASKRIADAAIDLARYVAP